MFVDLSAFFVFERVARRETRGVDQPAGQRRWVFDAAGFFRKNDENGLRDVVGSVRVAHLAQRGRIHQMNMPLDQLLKHGMRAVAGVIQKQLSVVVHGGFYWVMSGDRRSPTRTLLQNAGVNPPKYNRRWAAAGGWGK